MSKQELWNMIEKYAPNLSDEIGWGSMDSLCDEIMTDQKQEAVDKAVVAELERFIKENEPAWEQIAEGLVLFGTFNDYLGKIYKCCNQCGFSPMAMKDHLRDRISTLTKEEDQ
jgi:hypothetical protein